VAVKLGVPEARLTKSQTEMWVTRATAVRMHMYIRIYVCVYMCTAWFDAPRFCTSSECTHQTAHTCILTCVYIYPLLQMAGGSVGIAVGCVLGMLPLLFIDGKKGDREESPT
jgi:hypothetical protein